MDNQPQSGPAPKSVLWQRQIFELLVEQVKDYAIFLVDLQGRVGSWNSGAWLVKGYNADEIIGQPMTCFYLPEDLQANLPTKLLETARGQGRVEAEGWRLRKDGSPFWANVVITALRDESGILVSYAKVTRDLTERHRLDQELHQLRRDLERHVEELALWNADLAKRTQQVTALNSELHDKLVELETFFDIATDRELTMIDLEKQIQQLMKENELLRTTSSKPFNWPLPRTVVADTHRAHLKMIPDSLLPEQLHAAWSINIIHLPGGIFPSNWSPWPSLSIASQLYQRLPAFADPFEPIIEWPHGLASNGVAVCRWGADMRFYDCKKWCHGTSKSKAGSEAYEWFLPRLPSGPLYMIRWREQSLRNVRSAVDRPAWWPPWGVGYETRHKKFPGGFKKN